MRIQPEIFSEQFDRFREAVASRQGGQGFTSFHEGLVASKEGYKEHVRAEALRRLQADSWTASDVGGGTILARVVAAIEIKESKPTLRNSLVEWERKGRPPESVHHRALLAAGPDTVAGRALEQACFDIFHSEPGPAERAAFERFVELAGRHFDLVAYLFFLKDQDRFMPLRPQTFAKALRRLGEDPAGMQSCSWDNYRRFLDVLGAVRDALRARPGFEDVRLLDAHSFCWMLVPLDVAPPRREAARSGPPRVWRIYVRERDGGPEYAEEAVRGGFIALGGAKADPVERYETRKAFVAAFCSHHERGRPRANQIWRMHTQMRHHDWVVMPSSKLRRVHVGRVEDEDCYFQGRGDACPFPFRRRVRWLGSASYEDAREHLGAAAIGQGAMILLDASPSAVLRLLRHVDQADLRDRPLRYWAFGRDPRLYRLDDAVASAEVDYWVTGTKPISPGDRLIIWKFKGSGRTRGVVALGVVVGPPEIRSDTDNPFWIRPEAAEPEALHVPVRYVQLPAGPLWLGGEADAALRDLPIARAGAGSAFQVTPEQWEAVVAAAGGWPGLPPEAPRSADEHLTSGRRGQGRGLPYEAQRAVELHAMALAVAHYADGGWGVKDVSRNHSYDIHCTREDEELRVEVKGTTTAGETVFLTKNEVEHAREHLPRVALFVVSEIVLDRDEDAEYVASGGAAQEHHPWEIDPAALVALSFEYRVPPHKGG